MKSEMSKLIEEHSLTKLKSKKSSIWLLIIY